MARNATIKTMKPWTGSFPERAPNRRCRKTSTVIGTPGAACLITAHVAGKSHEKLVWRSGLRVEGKFMFA